MNASGTVFHFKPREGLANRLRAIRGAYALARKVGWHLKVYWYDLPNCHVKWADIFNSPAALIYLDVDGDNQAALRVRCRRTRRGLLRFWMGRTVFCALRGLGLVRRYKCN